MTTTTGAAPRLVLFDFDGVLFREDAFGQFVRASFRRSCWRLVLAALLMLPALPSALFTRRLLLWLGVQAVLLGQGERVFRRRVGDFGRMLARQPGRFHRDGIVALRRHLAAGDRVLVVTGCEHTLASELLDELGLGELELIASQLVPGRLGMRVQSHNVGSEKVRRLAAHGLDHQQGWDVAYTDSLQDVPMLRPAREPVLVNATPARCRAMERALGRAVTRVHWY